MKDKIVLAEEDLLALDTFRDEVTHSVARSYGLACVNINKDADEPGPLGSIQKQFMVEGQLLNTTSIVTVDMRLKKVGNSNWAVLYANLSQT